MADISSLLFMSPPIFTDRNKMKNLIFTLILASTNLAWALDIKIPTASEINQITNPIKADCEALAEPIIPIKKERLRECYGQFPLIMNILYLVSDNDFLDIDKKQNRKIDFQKDMAKNRSAFQKCSKDILQYSKENNDQKNHSYIELRMTEVSGALEPSGPLIIESR